MAKGQSRKGQPRNRGKLMSEASFARLWGDPAVSLRELAELLGVSRQAVSIRARVRGLPPRVGPGTSCRPRIEDSAPELAAMWNANVGLRAMADHFDCCHTAVLKAASRLGLPKRHLTRWHLISVADFRALQLREAMAASARETLGHMACAEMLDDPRRVLRRAA